VSVLQVTNIGCNRSLMENQWASIVESQMVRSIKDNEQLNGYIIYQDGTHYFILFISYFKDNFNHSFCV
jgi:hypothetical protein